MIKLDKAPYKAAKVWILRPVTGGHQRLALLFRAPLKDMPDSEWGDLVQGLLDLFGNGAEAWSAEVTPNDLCFEVLVTTERPKADPSFIQKLHAKKHNLHVGQNQPLQPFPQPRGVSTW